MTDKQQIKVTKKFESSLEVKGNEKQETAVFWIDLIQNVLGGRGYRLKYTIFKPYCFLDKLITERKMHLRTDKDVT